MLKLLALSAAALMTFSAPQTDPLSGKWGSDGRTVLDLKLGSDGSVSGQVMSGRPDNMVPITRGTFNRQTGELQLAGDARSPDGTTVLPYTIQGALAGDSLTVNAAFGDYRGSLTLRRVGLPQGTPGSSPSAPGISEELRKAFEEVHAAISKSADLVPADKYAYRPVSTVRTFGELVGHVADSYVWYCTRASGRNVEWSDAIEKGKTDKTTVTQKLRESLAVCTAAYSNTSSVVGGLLGNVSHTNLHYGNMITYLRMMGLVPPTS